MSRWYELSYKRLLIDSHITEDDPAFLKHFSVEKYVSMVEKAKVDSAMVYACCHNGNCYYPTKIGHMHKNLNGRDVFGQIIELLRHKGIKPVAYYTVIYHNHSAKNNPAWRVTHATGIQHNKRYWYSCPNCDAYVEFVQKQLEEIINYNIDGIFIDMTFWPGVCCCHNCRKRFLKETNREIPETIDWNNPIWVKFQRKREQWISLFANKLSSYVKAVKAELTVTHQLSPVLSGWYLSQSTDIASVCDYASGDFYGGRNQQRLATKIFSALSINKPFEFHTSRCVDLHDHTSMKSEPEMICSAATTISAGGAFLFIDAINRDGTLQDKVYERIGNVNKTLELFVQKVKEIKAEIYADVGIYFSMPSHMDEKLNELKLQDILSEADNMNPSIQIEPLKEVLGTSIILNKAKIPYQIVTDKTKSFKKIKTLIMNNIKYMSESEVNMVRDFVKNGGSLIVTGMTSYYNMQGQTSGDFALSDVFGVSFSQKFSSRVSYLNLLPEYFILSNYPAALVKKTDAEVLGKVAMPLFDPDDSDHYASIHSNPPAALSEYDGLTFHSYGKGCCLYIYSSILAIQQYAQQSFAVNLFKQHIATDIILKTNVPDCVEITILKSTLKNTYLICFVNYQEEQPNIPVYNLKTTIRLPDDRRSKKCCCVSNGKTLNLNIKDNIIEIRLDRLEVLEMISIEL